MKEQVYNNSGKIFGIDVNEMGMFNYDIAIVIALLIVSLFWKEQRNVFLVGAGLYLFFTLFWHGKPFFV